MKLTFNKNGKTYTIRPASPTDASQVSDFIKICSQALSGKNEMAADELANEWKMAGFDLEKDSLMVLEGEKLIGYADIWNVGEPLVSFQILVQVHPDYKGMGFGWLLNVWTETRSRESMQKSPAEFRIFMVNFVNVRDREALQLLTDFGATIERHAWSMERDLNTEVTEPILPEGYQIRVATLDEYPEVYRLQKESFQDHWGFIATTYEAGYPFFLTNYVETPIYTPELWYVVEHAGKLVGMLIGTASSTYGEDYGWVASLGVLREHRKKGLGKALLQKTFLSIQQMGGKKVGLNVDAQNLTGALKLYQDLGMVVSAEFIRFEKTLRDGIDLRTKEIKK